jgi:hypothetical protein
MKEQDKLLIYNAAEIIKSIRAAEHKYWLGDDNVEATKRIYALTGAMIKYRRQFLIYRVLEFLRLR